ncbi:hypothetical protein [Bacteroides sp.]|uniref:hypothetical protein n=1 Tax=Bacteroides sp. TaxID=29523 RepID=UPI003AB69501
MKKILLLMIFCTVTSGIAFSQTAKKSSKFQLSFVPPLSTNGIKAYEYSNGASFNLLAGISRNEENFSFAGLSNVITNDAKGFQFAGLSNFIGNNGRGMLFSGLANITKGSYSGFQFAGLINIAKNANGFQFAGLINKAKNVNGVQFAGIINIAENSDFPIGLINIIKNGEKGIAVTYNELGSTMVTFRSGGKVTYGIIGVGYNHKVSNRAYTVEAGLGAHINCLSWLRINNELKVASFGYSNNPFIADSKLSNPVFHVNYSLMPAFRTSRHFELFGGPSINYINARNTDSELIPNHSIWKQSGSTRIQQIYVGYQVGVQYIF